MKVFSQKSAAIKLALLLAVTSGGAVFAQQQLANSSIFNLRPSVEIKIDGTVRRNNEAVALAEAKAVNPGEILDWKVTSVNRGKVGAENYRVVGQIPAGTVFVKNSANAEGAPNVSYSIDNGKTFDAEPLIDERQPDGTIQQVPAPVAMYTQVRYQWSSQLAADSDLEANYQVRVK